MSLKKITSLLDFNSSCNGRGHPGWVRAQCQREGELYRERGNNGCKGAGGGGHLPKPTELP